MRKYGTAWEVLTSVDIFTVLEYENVTPDGKTNTAIFVGNFIKNSERGNGV